MSILESEKISKCFDGGSIIDYKLKSIITTDSIYKMSTLGKLDYYKSFPTRYFTVHLKDGGQIRGIEGDSTLRVIYDKNSQCTSKESVETFIQTV